MLLTILLSYKNPEIIRELKKRNPATNSNTKIRNSNAKKELNIEELIEGKLNLLNLLKSKVSQKFYQLKEKQLKWFRKNYLTLLF